MTLTLGNASIVIQARGGTSGGNASSVNLVLQLLADAGGVPGFPNCAVRGGTQGTGVPFAAPFKTIAVSPITMQYTMCQGFIDPPPQRTDVTEVSQLMLSKP